MSAPSFTQTMKKSEYLLRASEADENERLDIQHRLLLHMMRQNLLHPEIPKGFERVADIATGNGDWLFELKNARKESKSEPESITAQARYHGFDISPSLFPKLESTADIDFSVHDFYKPFPKEHLGKYDLVHARHLVLAVKKSHLQTAVDNISCLLKPGGYIQWEEYDFADQLAACPPCKMTSSWEVVFDWIVQRGYSLTFSSDVRDALASSGLEIVERKQFSTKGLPVSEDHRLTLLHAFYTGVPKLCWKAKGKSDEEVEQIMTGCFEEWERGVLLDYYFSRVVARRPVE
ncbi:S-adenosyl-L-methionine-dependent methyltransferase [Aspergillus falconensis]